MSDQAESLKKYTSSLENMSDGRSIPDGDESANQIKEADVIDPEGHIDKSDPLGLLQSEHIAAAAADASVASQSRKRKYKTEAEKLEANRRSAAESRHRKKVVLMQLQQEVISLRRENSLLLMENVELKKQINVQRDLISSLAPYKIPTSLSLAALNRPLQSALQSPLQSPLLGGVSPLAQNNFFLRNVPTQQQIPISAIANGVLPSNLKTTSSENEDDSEANREANQGF